MKLLHKVALGVIGLSTVASASDMKIYGFMDMNFQKAFTNDTTAMYYYGMKDGFGFSTGNINLYFDANVNENIRALVEVNLNVDPNSNSLNGSQVVRSSVPGYGVVDETVQASGEENVNTIVTDYNNLKKKSWVGLSLERAWFDYLLKDEANVRVGKFLTPYGIWNVDHGSPIIIPIQQPYEVGFTKIFPASQVGLMGYGTIFLGDYDLSYKLYAASAKSDAEVGNVAMVKDFKDLAGGGNLSVNLPYLDEFKVGISGYSGAEVITDNQLVIDIDIDPTTTPPTPISLPVVSSTQEYTKYEKLFCVGVDFRVSTNGFTLQGEYNRQQRKNYLVSVDKKGIYQGYYGLLAYKYRVNPKLYLMPFGMYEVISSDIDEGGNFHGPVEKELQGYNVISAGLNIGLFSNTNIKFEYDMSKVDVSKEAPVKDGFLDVSIFKTQFTVAF